MNGLHEGKGKRSQPKGVYKKNAAIYEEREDETRRFHFLGSGWLGIQQNKQGNRDNIEENPQAHLPCHDHDQGLYPLF